MQLLLILYFFILLLIHVLFLFSEPTNMLDMKAIIWLENYLQVSEVSP